jgi:hypothetical protein
MTFTLAACLHLSGWGFLVKLFDHWHAYIRSLCVLG